MKQATVALFAISWLFRIDPAMAQDRPPDAVAGQALASRLCASCHAVDLAGTASARADIPSFSAIARSPRATAERLAGAIIIPHPMMPGVPLTRNEIRDLIAFILSLKPRN